MNYRKASLWLLFAIILLASVQYVWAWVEMDMPFRPEQRTGWAMANLKGEIQVYFEKHHALPEKLDELSRIDDRDRELVDGWGRKIMYEHNDNNDVTLTSYGKDGLPGGTGKNANIILKFPVFLWTGCETNPVK